MVKLFALHDLHTMCKVCVTIFSLPPCGAVFINACFRRVANFGSGPPFLLTLQCRPVRGLCFLWVFLFLFVCLFVCFVLFFGFVLFCFVLFCFVLLCLFVCLFVCLFFGFLFCFCFLFCLTSQQHASVYQGRICSDSFTCCQTEIEVADQTFHLTQSQYTDTGPTSPSTDPISPGAWQGGHWSASF